MLEAKSAPGVARGLRDGTNRRTPPPSFPPDPHPTAVRGRWQQQRTRLSCPLILCPAPNPAPHPGPPLPPQVLVVPEGQAAGDAAYTSGFKQVGAGCCAGDVLP